MVCVVVRSCLRGYVAIKGSVQRFRDEESEPGSAGDALSRRMSFSSDAARHGRKHYPDNVLRNDKNVNCTEWIQIGCCAFQKLIIESTSVRVTQSAA